MVADYSLVRNLELCHFQLTLSLMPPSTDVDDGEYKNLFVAIINDHCHTEGQCVSCIVHLMCMS